jgi:8-oxo-dGTP pyrophosphatase MutT (NUDIX family)
VIPARAPEPGGPVPAWLRELAAAARTMEISPLLVPPATGGRPSAVLVLFGDGPGGPDLLFIQRSEGLRLHAGQPAFPGGAIDDGDGGPVGAALREAAEEVGLDPAGVDVVGTLPEVFIPRTGFRVVPVLAWWRRPSAVAPVDAGEVAAVERVGVAELADPATRLMVRVPGGRNTPAFRVRSMLIWGFTAALVDRLLALGGWEKPWDPGVVADL